MNSAEVIRVLILFLTIKITTGKYPPDLCSCLTAGSNTMCVDLGCSLGNNAACNDGTFDFNGTYYVYQFINWDDGYASGCNCPNTPSTATHNSIYYDGLANVGVGYNYDSCTGFGGNARHSSGEVPAGANAAVDCCNFCCNRNDSYPMTTTTTAITTTTVTTTTSTGGDITSYKSLCFIALTMLIMANLQIN